jgi:hypothetical protein
MKVSQEQNGLFYKELGEKEEDDDDGETEQSSCLISNMPLDENSVTMECGHKFNYIPLYNDLVNHKTKFNSMEKKYLNYNEIRCPYCRRVQKSLLPYIELPNVQKTHGVNFINESKFTASMKSGMTIGPCSYQTTTHVNGILTVVLCPNKYVYFIPGLEKHICALHQSTAIKEYKLAKKQEEKKKIQEEKKKVQEEKKKKKDAEKQKKKEEKEKAKVGAPISAATSAATSVTTQATQSSSSAQLFCTQIFVSGKNKGKQCGYKSHDNGLCKRHYGLTMKKYGQTQQHEPDVESQISS